MWRRRAVLAAGAAMGVGLLLPAGRSLAATDQLRVGLPAEPPHLDPTADGNPATNDISYQNLFEGLTRINETGAVRPGLAKSWTVSPDGLNYVFTLQQEARFHDGTSFDADHVVFSLNRLASPQNANPRKSLYGVIASVAAPDAATARIGLKHADPDFLFNLGRPEASIVAPESADNNKEVPIGTGPFALVQWDKGQRVLLQRNEDYWGEHPRINEAILVFIADPKAAVDALLANDIDGYLGLPASQPLEALKGNSAYKVIPGITADKAPIVGVWGGKLTGMWANYPLGGCVLGSMRWADDNGGPALPPTPAPNAGEES